jgi:DNA helicase-2/ATP-dependent DNA helicase PcrA
VGRLVRFAEANHCSLWNAVCRAEEIADDIRATTRDQLAAFVTLVRGLGEQLQSGVSAVDAARQLMDRIDLIGDIRSASTSIPAAQRRIDNIETFLRSLTRQQERAPGADSLLEYLRQLSLAVSEDERGEADDDKVTLSTLHGAKGLEFPVVFFIGLEEEIIPHSRTLNPTATDVLDPEHATDVSEERRLAYVGITRAKQRLYLSRAVVRNRHGKLAPRTPSRFLMEIPEDLVDVRDLADEAQQEVDTSEAASFFANFEFD